MKKLFISFFLLISILMAASANTNGYIGLSLEGAFVPNTKFGEKCVPIRPTLYFAVDTFPFSDTIGFHVDCNFLPVGWDSDDDDVYINDDPLLGVSLSVLIAPVINVSDVLYISPGISMGFAIFGTDDESFGDSYLGLGINSYFVISNEFTIGFTGDYYPLYHYTSKNHRRGSHIDSTADLVRFGMYLAWKF